MDDRGTAIVPQTNEQVSGINYVIGSVVLLLRALNNLGQDWRSIWHACGR